MVLINKVFDFGLIEQLITDRFVTKKSHPKFPNLKILNYSPTAQYASESELVWGPEISACRGLIYDESTMEIIARPFPKFWNINDSRHPETMEENLPNRQVLFTDKLDGSLGVIYFYNDELWVATRGSFDSDQSRWATEWIRGKFPRLKPLLDKTLLAEIIYADNQIVVQYDKDEMVMLGIVDNLSGIEIPRSQVEEYCRAISFPLVQKFRKTLPECIAEDKENSEGYVATYENGLKIKIKFDTYCRLHKVLTGLNPVSIWELLNTKNENTLQNWLADEKMPSSFKEWLNTWLIQLRSDFIQLKIMSKHIFDSRPVVNTRKEEAEYFLREDHKKYSTILFTLLDDREIDDLIWKQIKPKAADTFRIDGE